jgi:hypothetical protein
MQWDTNPGGLANRAPRLSALPPAARASVLAGRTVQLQPALTSPAGAATAAGARPGFPAAGNPVAPPVYRPQMTPLSMQPRMANGTVNRSPAPPVFSPQQTPIALQTKGPSTQTRITGHALQPFATGVIQAKCKTCGANSHSTKNCPHTKTAPPPTPRSTAPSTLGTSHTRTTPSGNFVGHGAQAGAGGHRSGRRRRILGNMLANSQNS